MLKICHRINTIEALQAMSQQYGVEIDLHAYGDKLVLQHDALVTGTDFDAWCDHFRHAFLILNIKEEGIESLVRQKMQERGIDNYFMLDLSFPALVKMIHIGESRVAIRVSCYEPVATALAFADKAQWVWLDVFENKIPLTPEEYQALRIAGYKICLVSPELHGRDPAEIVRLQTELAQQNFRVDAICSKSHLIDRWEN